MTFRGIWLVQSEEHVIVDLTAVSLSPTLGAGITSINKTLKKINDGIAFNVFFNPKIP